MADVAAFAFVCTLRTGTLYSLGLYPVSWTLTDFGLKPGKAPSPNNYSNVGLRRQKTWGPPLRQPLPWRQQAHGDQHSQALRRSPRVIVRGPVANHKEACWACESEDDGVWLLGLVGMRAAGAH